MRAVFILIVLVAGSGMCEGIYAQTSKVASSGQGSQVWKIPFGSEGNTISLSVANNSSIDANNVSVTFTNLPSWLEFKSNTMSSEGKLQRLPIRTTLPGTTR